MAKIFNWKKGINQKELKIVINTLNNDGIIIFPTDTVYGIGTKIFDIEGIEKIYKIKNRPYNKPLACLCYDINQINSIAYINDSAINYYQVL